MYNSLGLVNLDSSYPLLTMLILCHVDITDIRVNSLYLVWILLYWMLKSTSCEFPKLPLQGKKVLEDWEGAEDTAWESKLQLISVSYYCCLRFVLHTEVWKSRSFPVAKITCRFRALLKLRPVGQHNLTKGLWCLTSWTRSSAGRAAEVHCWSLADKKQLWMFILFLLFRHHGPHGNKHWLVSSEGQHVPSRASCQALQLPGPVKLQREDAVQAFNRGITWMDRRFGYHFWSQSSCSALGWHYALWKF